jgi:hypothetical protein
LHGKLNRGCQRCYQVFEWKKSKFYLDDFYPDWRIDVFCKCGLNDDPEVAQIAREAYDDQLYADIETQQQNALDAALTRSGNLFFETLCGGTGSVS